MRLLLALPLLFATAATAAGPLLLQKPAVSRTHIVFVYAGDLWSVPRTGGDALPWLFRQANLGAIVGKRTWGGLVGIFGFPALIDGGRVTAPNLAFWNLKGNWEVEFDPHAWREGKDPQLEKAMEVVLAALKKNPPPVYKQPAYPNYHKGAER